MNKVRDLDWYRKRVNVLRSRPVVPQKSAEWFKMRNTVLTASEIASCLTLSKKHCETYVNAFNIKSFKYNELKSANAYENKTDYIIKKCKAFYGENVFSDNVYTLWGKKYEDVALNLYKKLKNKKVYEFGLLKHPRLNWLGASPDGITEDGVMLEIKCPYSRKIKDTVPPLHYYIQVQLQLEVGMLDEADFLECEIKEFLTFEEYIDYGDKTIPKGIVLEKMDGKFIYQDAHDSKDAFLWANDFMYYNHPEEFKIHYFYIPKYNIINIKRDPVWFANVKEDLRKTYNEVKMYQSDPIKFQELLN